MNPMDELDFFGRTSFEPERIANQPSFEEVKEILLNFKEYLDSINHHYLNGDQFLQKLHECQQQLRNKQRIGLTEPNFSQDEIKKIIDKVELSLMTIFVSQGAILQGKINRNWLEVQSLSGVLTPKSLITFLS